MKNKIILAFLLALPMMFTSCLKDQDDVLNTSSSDRLNNAQTETKKDLMSQETWLMDYYFGAEYAYGGTYFFLSFDSTMVNVQSARSLEGEKSHYKMATHNGAVLSFDTYNSVFHYLAVPNQNMPEGYEADFEFSVVSATSDLVTLRGLRTNNICYLRPFAGDKKAYVDAVAKMEEDIIVSTISGVVGEDSIVGALDLDTRSIQFVTKSGDDVKSHNTSYVYTDKGLRVCLPIELGQKTIQDFAFNDNNVTFECVEEANKGIVLQGLLPKGYVRYDDFAGDYYFPFVTVNESNQAVEPPIKVTLTPNEARTAYLMKGLNPQFDVVLNFNKSTGSLRMNTQVVGEDAGNTLFYHCCSYDASTGYFTGPWTSTSSAYGMMTELATDTDGHTVYNWVNIDNEDGFDINSYVLLSYDGGSSVSLYSNPEWYFTGDTDILLYVLRLIKI